MEHAMVIVSPLRRSVRFIFIMLTFPNISSVLPIKILLPFYSHYLLSGGQKQHDFFSWSLNIESSAN